MMLKSKTVYYIIYFLTILDITLTAAGLQLGVIEEANPIMNYFISLSMELSMIGVLLFVGAMLIFLYKASLKVNWLQKAVTGLAYIKVYVLLLHLSWINSYIEKIYRA
jgi:inner membrane protein involved in colicin E2 resistance